MYHPFYKNMMAAMSSKSIY